MQLYENNKTPYYAVTTPEQKAYALSVFEKYNIDFANPKIRVPFFITLETDYSDHSNIGAGIKKIDNLGIHYFSAPLNHLEDNLIIENRPEIALNASQTHVINRTPPEMTVSETEIFKTKDGRLFQVYSYKGEISNGETKTFFNTNFRMKSYFHRSELIEKINMATVDYISCPE